MKDPESAPSPNRFCRRLGMRKAAVKASAASVRWPKYLAKSTCRASPARRLSRMPAPTDFAATRESGPGNTLGSGRGLPREPRHDDGVLLQVLLAHALVQIHVGVVHADVVVLVLLDRVEAGHPDGSAAEMIGVADPGDD